jgi:hypothetical protein
MPDLPNHLPIQPTPFMGREKEVACTGYLVYLFENEPLISDEWHESENERQDLQAVET